MKVFPLVGVLCKNVKTNDIDIVQRASIDNTPILSVYTLASRNSKKSCRNLQFAWVDTDSQEETEWLGLVDWMQRYEKSHRLVGALAIRQGSGLNTERVIVTGVNEYTGSFTYLRNGVSVNTAVSGYRFSFKNSYGWQLFSSLNEERY